jgi:hypothetical protein
VRGRGLIVSHPVARGAEWACAAGDAKYVLKMVTGSCAAVVAWAGSIGAEWPAPPGPAGLVDSLGTGNISWGRRPAQGGIIGEATHLIASSAR